MVVRHPWHIRSVTSQLSHERLEMKGVFMSFNTFAVLLWRGN